MPSAEFLAKHGKKPVTYAAMLRQLELIGDGLADIFKSQRKLIDQQQSITRDLISRLDKTQQKLSAAESRIAALEKKLQ